MNIYNNSIDCLGFSSRSPVHVALNVPGRPIFSSTSQIARSGFSTTTDSRASSWLLSLLLYFSRFSSESKKSNIYNSFSFSFPILLLTPSSLSPRSLCRPLPPGAETGTSVARRRRPPSSSSISCSSFSFSSSSSLPLSLAYLSPPSPSYLFLFFRPGAAADASQGSALGGRRSGAGGPRRSPYLSPILPMGSATPPPDGDRVLRSSMKP